MAQRRGTAAAAATTRSVAANTVEFDKENVSNTVAAVAPEQDGES